VTKPCPEQSEGTPEIATPFGLAMITLSESKWYLFYAPDINCIYFDLKFFITDFFQRSRLFPALLRRIYIPSQI
jgi:hypothetical protein